MTTPVKIHPYDLCELIEKIPASGYIDLVKSPNPNDPHNDLIEIDGVVYEQSVEVPCKTKNIR